MLKRTFALSFKILQHCTTRSTSSKILRKRFTTRYKCITLYNMLQNSTSHYITLQAFTILADFLQDFTIRLNTLQNL